MTRTEARELLMQLLFEMEIQDDYGDQRKDRFLEEHFGQKNQRTYADILFQSIIEHLEEIDRQINDNSPVRTIERMSKVDLAILRTALGEISYQPDVPDAVVINEAVNMAKKYSTEDSKKFINGILGKIVKEKDVQ